MSRCDHEWSEHRYLDGDDLCICLKCNKTKKCNLPPIHYSPKISLEDSEAIERAFKDKEPQSLQEASIELNKRFYKLRKSVIEALVSKYPKFFNKLDKFLARDNSEGD